MLDALLGRDKLTGKQAAQPSRRLACPQHDGPRCPHLPPLFDHAASTHGTPACIGPAHRSAGYHLPASVCGSHRARHHRSCPARIGKVFETPDAPIRVIKAGEKRRGSWRRRRAVAQGEDTRWRKKTCVRLASYPALPSSGPTMFGLSLGAR
jgi:hypothetical protein